jgi:hypothetical protein
MAISQYISPDSGKHRFPDRMASLFICLRIRIIEPKLEFSGKGKVGISECGESKKTKSNYRHPYFPLIPVCSYHCWYSAATKFAAIAHW